MCWHEPFVVFWNFFRVVSILKFPWLWLQYRLTAYERDYVYINIYKKRMATLQVFHKPRYFKGFTV